jgi:Uma2 family endonuclease
MALHDRPVRLSYDDYLLIPEDGLRHEILDGEHYVSAAPFLRHQVVSRRFTLALGLFIEANGLGELFAAPADVVLSFYDVVQPDLVFVARERLHILTEKNIQGAPDLVIEILSGSTRRIDEGIKLAAYERFGVREYWLADPAQKTVTVHRLEEDSFRKTAELSAEGEDTLATPLLPGLEIRLAEIFA